MNPFLTKTYRGPEYFLDRETETAKLLDAIRSERNVTLYSHRRLGKTMLLQHVFSQLDSKTFEPLFVDLFATRNLIQFTQKLTEVLYDKKILRDNKLNVILGRLGASLSFDQLSGIPQINFNITDRSVVLKSIPVLFKEIISGKKNAVIAFDEFQELANYEEDIAEATVRTIMQDFPEITFIFSGSRKSLMKEIFMNANRPFFQSTQMMELHEIDRDIYAGEVFAILKKHDKPYDPDIVYKILDDTYCHTGFTQMVLSRVFSESEDTIDSEIYTQVWTDILEDHRSMAREQEFLLPALQWKTLVAIAKEGYVKEPQSREFAKKYDLSAPSSMARSVKALLDKGLIIDYDDKGLRVYNVFIRKNLQKLNI